MRLLITIEYDGTNYAGWQIQPNQTTVQGVLTNALSSLLKTEISLFASGRTDSGVHASGQTAHFDYDGSFPIERLPLAVNTLLPEDVRVIDCQIKNSNFHARFDVKKKTYIYRFYLSKISRPLKNHTMVHVPFLESDFDMDKAKVALSYFIGTHDFKAFCSTGRPVNDYRRTIYSADVFCKDGDYSLVITGNGFLYNMVRIIAGTVIEVALGKRNIDDVKKALELGKRSYSGKTYPAHGLILDSVVYD